jgi:hypothetical protein
VHQLPGEHALHWVAPLALAKVPAAHGVHSDWLVTLAKLPGAHSVGTVDPVGHDVPSGQVRQLALLDKFMALEKVPTGHGISDEEPLGQKCPAEHGTACTVAAVGQ